MAFFSHMPKKQVFSRRGLNYLLTPCQESRIVNLHDAAVVDVVDVVDVDAGVVDVDVDVGVVDVDVDVVDVDVDVDVVDVDVDVVEVDVVVVVNIDSLVGVCDAENLTKSILHLSIIYTFKNFIFSHI